MADLSSVRDILMDIGLEQYADIFLREGFDTWPTICEATETDLDYMDVKLGHRRRLQRAIAESTGSPTHHSSEIAVPNAGRPMPTLPKDSSSTSLERPDSASVNGEGPARKKRKYRRHPKPDANAPKRPPSAYVIFASDVRERLKDSKLDFTDMAKAVGARWQALPVEERERFESEANGTKDQYNAAMNDYRRTDEYEQYQRYLRDFKSRHEDKGDARYRDLQQVRSRDNEHSYIDRTRRRTSRSASDSTGTRQPVQHTLLGASETTSPSSRVPTAYASNAYTTDAWSPQSAQERPWGARYGPQYPSRFERPAIRPLERMTGSSSHSGSNSAYLMSPYQQPANGGSRFGGTGEYDERPSYYRPADGPQPTVQDRQYPPQPSSAKRPSLPTLLNPARSPSHSSYAPSPYREQNGQSQQDQERHDRRERWKRETLPNLYRGGGGQDESSNDNKRPSPARSPHTGRMMDGQMTPPAKIVEAAESDHTTQFPVQHELQPKGWESGKQHNQTEALLDSDLGSYRTGPRISELRSRPPPRPPSH